MRNMTKLIGIIGLVTVVCLVGIAPVMAADSVTGTIQQGDNGLVLQADDGEYILAGQDLSDMVGKKIKVTGTIADSDAGKTLTVMSFEEVQE